MAELVRDGVALRVPDLVGGDVGVELMDTGVNVDDGVLLRVGVCDDDQLLLGVPERDGGGPPCKPPGPPPKAEPDDEL